MDVSTLLWHCAAISSLKRVRARPRVRRTEAGLVLPRASNRRDLST